MNNFQLLIIAFSAFSVFASLFVYAACKAAAQADRIAEKYRDSLRTLYQAGG